MTESVGTPTFGKGAVRRWRRTEDAFMGLMPRRARRGSTWFGRMGDIVQQPPVWAGLAAVLALGKGADGRRAAVRGGVCYGVAAVAANLVIKPLVGRGRPRGSAKGRPGPVTSSFPSGHAATDLAFVLGASQELPILFVPLAATTLAAHWSLVRSRGHYPSDVLAGGALGVGVAFAVWRLWPPSPCSEEDNPAATGEEANGAAGP